MGLSVSSGQKFYIGPIAPTTPVDPTAYAALGSYTQLGNLESVSPFGDSASQITFSDMARQRINKFKGARDGGQVTISAGHDPLDVGQIALIAAEKTQFAYAFKLDLDEQVDAGWSTTLLYFTARVMQARIQPGDANNILKREYVLDVDSSISQLDPIAPAPPAPPSLPGAVFGASGIGDRYTYALNSNWNMPATGDVTVACLMRWDSSAGPTFQNVWSAGTNTPAYALQAIQSSGFLSFAVSGVVCTTDIAVPADGTWRLVICERDSTRQSLKIWICAPGGAPQLAAYKQDGTTGTQITPTEQPMIAHRSDVGATRYFKGAVRNFFKLNSLLTRGEMFKLACGQDIIADLGKAPVIYNKFSSVSGATEVDTSGNGNTATKVGAPTLSAAIPLPTTTISVSGINVLRRVHKKNYGDATAPISVHLCYRGTIANPQYRILDLNGLTTVVDWTSLPGTFPASDTPTSVSTSVDVPASAGGRFYKIEVRAYGGVVEPARHVSRPWAVGYVFLCIGQSNMDRMFVNTLTTSPDVNTNVLRFRYGAEASRVPFNKPIGFAGQGVYNSQNVPVELIDGSRGGTALLAAADGGSGYWLDTAAGSPYANSLIPLADADNNINGIFWSQGEQDGSAASIVEASYFAAQKTVFDRYRTLLGVPTLPVRIAITGPSTPVAGSVATFEASFQAVRRSQINYYTSDPYGKVGISQMDAPLSGDTIHPPDTFYAPMSKRWGAAALEMLGVAGQVGAAGPSISALHITGAVATVVLTHLGGTDVVIPVAAQIIDGFEFSIDNFATTIPYTASARVNATTLSFTFGSAPGGTLKVRYGQKIKHAPFVALASGPITTFTGTPTVRVAMTAHGLALNNQFNINQVAAVGGIAPNGVFLVSNVVDANNFEFTYSVNATSSATGGGASVTLSRYNIVTDNNFLQSETIGQPIQPTYGPITAT